MTSCTLVRYDLTLTDIYLTERQDSWGEMLPPKIYLFSDLGGDYKFLWGGGNSPPIHPCKIPLRIIVQA